MNVTFLVTLNTDDTDLVTLASEIRDELSEFDVVDVAAWARSSQKPIQSAPLPQPYAN